MQSCTVTPDGKFLLVAVGGFQRYASGVFVLTWRRMSLWASFPTLAVITTTPVPTSVTSCPSPFLRHVNVARVFLYDCSPKHQPPPVRSTVLITGRTRGGYGFLSVLDLGLQQSTELGFERLGADLLVVDRTAKVVSRKRCLPSPTRCFANGGVGGRSATAVDLRALNALCERCPVRHQYGLVSRGQHPAHGIDPEHDSTVQPWLNEQRD